jgi:F-type H+-transporting ATPase subunit b
VGDAFVTVLAAEGGAEVEGSAILVPAIYDIVWSAVAFTIIFFLFWKWVLPRLKVVLEERTENIEKKLEKAEADRAEAAELLEQYRAQLADARAEAARMRADGQAQRAAIVAEAKGEAEAAARAVNESAQARISSEASAAKAQLSREVGVLASDLAERIIGGSLDPVRTQATIDRFIADLEAAAPQAAGAGGQES